MVCDGAAVPANPGVNPTLTSLQWPSMRWRVPAKEEDEAIVAQVSA
jgi:hypothetical protein